MNVSLVLFSLILYYSCMPHLANCLIPETMSPSNMRNDHNNAKADCYTPAEISAGFNASAISSEFPKRVNPFLKDVVNFDELNGNREEEDEDDENVRRMYNNNLKRASEPAIMHSASTEMINEEDEGVDEEVVEGEEEEEEDDATRTIEEVGQEQQPNQDECNQNETIDVENNSSKMMQDSDGEVLSFYICVLELKYWFYHSYGKQLFHAEQA